MSLAREPHWHGWMGENFNASASWPHSFKPMPLVLGAVTTLMNARGSCVQSSVHERHVDLRSASQLCALGSYTIPWGPTRAGIICVLQASSFFFPSMSEQACPKKHTTLGCRRFLMLQGRPLIVVTAPTSKGTTGMQPSGQENSHGQLRGCKQTMPNTKSFGGKHTFVRKPQDSKRGNAKKSCLLSRLLGLARNSMQSGLALYHRGVSGCPINL